jgi:putative DNA primase/helicase
MIEKNKKTKKLDINRIANLLMNKFHFITIKETRKLYVYKNGIYDKGGEDIAENYIVKNFKDQATKRLRQEVIEQMKILTKISIEEVKTQDNLICVNNGVLNLETKELIPFSNEYIFFSKIPVNYDKDAKYKKFKEYLEEVVTKYNAQQLQEFIGYTLMTNTSKYEKALILHGEGGRGKSTFLKIISALLGKQNVCAFTLQQLQDKVILVELFGKIANISMDIPNERILNNEHIKSIISGDRITGRGLFKDPLTFVPTCKLMFSCNVLPEPNLADGDAFFDRWIYVKFSGKNYRRAGRDGTRIGIPDYDKIIIKEELSGILNWALDGYDFVKLSEFSDVSRVKENWMRNSDNVMAYRIDRLTETFDDNDWIIKKNIYKDYRKYCKEKKFVPFKSNAFHQKLQKMLEIEEYNPTVDGKQRRAWCGIRFKI